MADFMQALQTVEGLGKNNEGKPLFKQEIVYKDTQFVEAAATISSYQVFTQNNNVVPAYKNGYFPQNQYATKVKYIRIVPELINTGSTALLAIGEMNRFLQDSYLDFTIGQRYVGRIYLWQCIDSITVPNFSAIVTTAAPFIQKDLFTKWHELDIPHEIGAGTMYNVTFTPALNWTCSAYNAANTPSYPGSGMGNTEHGFAIRYYLKGDQFSPAQI